MSSVTQHEEASVEMFNHIRNQPGLKEAFEVYGLYEDDFTFIEKLIRGQRGTDAENPSQTDTGEVMLACQPICCNLSRVIYN